MWFNPTLEDVHNGGRSRLSPSPNMSLKGGFAIITVYCALISLRPVALFIHEVHVSTSKCPCVHVHN
jgi:hypothetical protein